MLIASVPRGLLADLPDYVKRWKLSSFGTEKFALHGGGILI